MELIGLFQKKIQPIVAPYGATVSNVHNIKSLDNQKCSPCSHALLGL